MDKQSSIIVGLLLLLLITFGASNATSYFAARQALHNVSENELMPLLSGAALRDIESDLESKLRSVTFMANERWLVEWINNGEQDPAKVSDYLAATKRTHGFDSTFLVSTQTHNYYYPEGVLRTLSKDSGIDDWFFNFVRQRMNYDIDVDYDEANGGRMTLFANFALQNAQGETLAVVGAGFDLSELVAKLQKDRERFGSDIYTIDQNGFIQIHPDGDFIFADENQQQRNHIKDQPGLFSIAAQILREQSEYSSFHIRKNGRSHFVAARYMPNIGWYLIAEQSEPASVQRLIILTLANLVIAITATLLVVVIVLFLRRSYHQKLALIQQSDTLEGVKTYPFFARQFDDICSVFEQKHLYLLQLDIDDYRSFCAAEGRDAGQVVLERTVRLMYSTLGGEIEIARLNNDVFVCVVGADSDRQMENVLNSLRIAIATEYEPNEKLCTATIVAMPIVWGVSLSKMIAELDKAVVAQKQHTSSRVQLLSSL